jgi:urea ABC transporter urea binding protein
LLRIRQWLCALIGWSVIMSDAMLSYNLIQPLPPMPVGVLCSQTGVLAQSERGVQDATLMAIAEINAKGGILGRQIQPLTEDGASDPLIFELKARQFLQDQQISTLFGCWSSACRKQLLPVLEQMNGLLWYPVQYEGLESSRQIFYTGACANQQLEPALEWLQQHQGKRIYLLGSDYVFPRVSNRIAQSLFTHQGGEVVGEAYTNLTAEDFSSVIAEIKRLKPDAVLSTLNGASNVHFYQQYARQIAAAEIPIMALSIAEEEVQAIGSAATGHYAIWSYFQSLERDSNREFVQRFQAIYGHDRVVSDPIATAYSQVYLWKQAVETAGSFEVDAVRSAAYGQTWMSPSGPIQLEPNHHVQRPWFIGKIQPTGQFAIVAASKQAIKPKPWLGVEDKNFARSAVIIDLLAEVPKALLYNGELKEKSHQLEQTIIALNSTIQKLQSTQGQLVQVEKLSSLGHLIANVAHEINNPLNFIASNLEIAQTYAASLLDLIALYQQTTPIEPAVIQDHKENIEFEFLVEDFPKLMKSMQMGTDRIQEISSSLRTFSRMDDTLLQTVDLHEGIENTLIILKHRLKAQSDRPEIQIQRDYGDLPPVECYVGQLNQVFMNLIANAIDALEEGYQNKIDNTPTITLKTRLESNQQVLVQIQDNGDGIPAAIQQRIFETFFTTKPVGKGTGLGLSISHQVVVEKHHGSLTCNSELGQGTTFSIRLPLSQTASLIARSSVDRSIDNSFHHDRQDALSPRSCRETCCQEQPSHYSLRPFLALDHLPFPS